MGYWAVEQPGTCQNTESWCCSPQHRCDFTPDTITVFKNGDVVLTRENWDNDILIEILEYLVKDS